MRFLDKCFLLILSMAFVGMAHGQTYYQEHPQARKDIQFKVIELQQAKDGWIKARTDLNKARKELAVLNQRVHNMQASQALQDTIAKDAGDVQTYIYEIMADVSYLKTQWWYLTDQEKELVTSVEKMIT